jgi:hypothetical protein
MSRYKFESPYNGSGALTREQFLFYETRIIAKLLCDDGLTDEEAIEKVVNENLFQYPTERMIKNIAKGCVRRLHIIDDEKLVDIIAHQPSDVAKQACTYAMMKQYRLVWDYMILVIGEKYRNQDMSYGKQDINVFFMRIQEQDDAVASWSDQTIVKLKQVLNKILIENEYIDGPRADKLNLVWLNSNVEYLIRNNGDEVALVAFNCFD